MKKLLSTLLVLGLAQSTLAAGGKGGGRERTEDRDSKKRAEETLGAQSRTGVKGIESNRVDSDIFKMLFGTAKASAEAKAKKYFEVQSADKELQNIFSEMEQFLRGRSYESEDAKVAANIVDQILIISKESPKSAEARFLKDLLATFVATGNLKLAVEDAASKTSLNKLRLGEEFKTVESLEKRLKEECRKG